MERPARAKPKTAELQEHQIPRRPRAIRPVGEPGPNLRWDKMTDRQRREYSARVARSELLAQGVPLVATQSQHAAVARIMAACQSRAGSTQAVDPQARDEAPPPSRSA